MGILLFAFQAVASEQKLTVQAKVTVDPYLTVILDSKAVKIEADGNESEVRDITAGSLFFGNFNPQLLTLGNQAKKLAYTPEGNYFSTEFITRTAVNIINNSKAFELHVSIVPDENGSILDLKRIRKPDSKDAREICSLSLMATSIKDVTKHANHLVNPGKWLPFQDSGEMIVYDSRGEVVTDSFFVSFAVLDLYPNTLAGHYGGKILWNVIPTL